MVRSPSPRLLRKKDSTRLRILTSAIRLFSEHGFAQTTVDQIAHAADIGKGTVYNYFPAKEDILAAFLADREHDLASHSAPLAHSPLPLPDILSAYLRLHLQLKEPHRDFVRVFFAHIYLSTNEFPFAAPPLQSFFSTLRDRQLLPPDTDIPALVQLFRQYQFSLTTVWLFDHPPYEHTYSLIPQQVALLCRGFAPSPDP